MNPTKKEYNQRQLRKLKLASLKYKESMLTYQINNGYDNKTIKQTMSDIQKLKTELKK